MALHETQDEEQEKEQNDASKLTLRLVEALSFLIHEDEEEKERHVQSYRVPAFLKSSKQ